MKENDSNKNIKRENKNFKYIYCNTISGKLIKLNPFNKLYNIKNNNSINSFSKKIMNLNIKNNYNYKKMDNYLNIKFGKMFNNEKKSNNTNDNNNSGNPSLITNENMSNKNIILNENIMNINFNSINSVNSSKNLNNKEKKFSIFL